MFLQLRKNSYNKSYMENSCKESFLQMYSPTDPEVHSRTNFRIIEDADYWVPGLKMILGEFIKFFAHLSFCRMRRISYLVVMSF